MWVEKSDEEIVSFALNLWANWIETDNPTLSRADAENMSLPVPNLEPGQFELIQKLRRLSENVCLARLSAEDDACRIYKQIQNKLKVTDLCSYNVPLDTAPHLQSLLLMGGYNVRCDRLDNGFTFIVCEGE